MEFTSDATLEIAVHDDAAALTRLFRLPVAERAPALAVINGGENDPLSIMLASAHQTGDGFRVDVDDPRYPAARARLIEADAWGQLRRDLARAWEIQSAAVPGLRHPTRVDVQLTLGYPDDPIFINQTLGYYGMGAIRGRIWLVAWPTDYNVTRIGACAVHEFSHNLRYSNVAWTGTVEEWVIAEGLAEAFAVQICGADSTGAWYSRLSANAVDTAFDLVLASLTATDNASACVLGDETARKMGGKPVGMPHMGGYAVGRRIVERYLAAARKTAAQATSDSTDAILAGAGLGK